MAGKHANGEGSIYQRSDGRWAGAAYVQLSDGTRKRIHVYARTRSAVHDQLADKLTLTRSGIPTPVKEWSVGAYLGYWLTSVVTTKNRARTAELYESTIRVHLTPALGRIKLSKLSVRDVQHMFNHQLATGVSVRTVQRNRSVLRAALSRAVREELLVRNVAKLVDLPAWHRKPITPWTADEAATFLTAARDHRWYVAYLLLLCYGMRRGEVLGLRWDDIDFERRTVHINQQLQRVGGRLETGPVKTTNSRRALPLMPIAGEALRQLHDRHLRLSNALVDQYGDLVFVSASSTPVDPKNFARTFDQLRQLIDLPKITVHNTRHTAATLLKNLGVPARDAQLILGHSHITTTQQLYQHGDLAGQTRGLGQLEQTLTGGVAVKVAVNRSLSTGQSTEIHALTPGGPGGTRTLDTLLKRLLRITVPDGSTSVTARVPALLYAHMLACVAVNRCCQSTVPAVAGVDDAIRLVAVQRQIQGLPAYAMPDALAA